MAFQSSKYGKDDIFSGEQKQQQKATKKNKNKTRSNLNRIVECVFIARSNETLFYFYPFYNAARSFRVLWIAKLLHNRHTMRIRTREEEKHRLNVQRKGTQQQQKNCAPEKFSLLIRDGVNNHHFGAKQLMQTYNYPDWLVQYTLHILLTVPNCRCPNVLVNWSMQHRVMCSNNFQHHSMTQTQRSVNPFYSANY